MKLFELKGYAVPAHHSDNKLEHEGYVLRQHTDHEYDSEGHRENSKIFHYISVPGKKEEFVDHSPYEDMSHEALKSYVKFHKKHGRFPERKDINSIGPLNNSDVVKLS